MKQPPLANSVPKQYAAKDYTDIQLLHEIVAANPQKSLSYVLNSFALSMLERDMTRPELKRLLRKFYDANKVRYILKKVDSHKANIASAPISEAVEHVRETLAAWQPLDLNPPA